MKVRHIIDATIWTKYGQKLLRRLNKSKSSAETTQIARAKNCRYYFLVNFHQGFFYQ